MHDADASGEMRPYVLAPDEGARSRNPTSEIVFKLLGAQSGGATNVFEIEVGPGLGPPLHYHEAQDEWLYVLEGDFRFEPVRAVAIVAGGTLASLLAGLGFALRPLGARPAQVLRARE